MEFHYDVVGKVRWPFGEAKKLAPAYAAELEVETNNSLVIIQPEQITGPMEITLNAANDQLPGDRVIVITNTSGTQAVSFAGDVTAPNITGVAGKTKVTELIFDGVEYKATGAPYQID